MMTDDWMQLADLSDHDDWTPPAKRTFPPKPQPLVLRKYEIQPTGGEPLQVEGSHLRLDTRGGLTVFSGQRPVAGFSADGWRSWQLLPDDDGDHAG